ncbi:hypothetical protein JJC00_04475 [Bradyrhizobium diazoefficiens]|uniref:DUF6650 family protein n=1 Tax=Bradyrhizobium diazoefficiens TaxID=1355477 RepID=UPI00190D8E87|nr:DUF6650 family protein [Bradyrhizobium diazoefficiens]QQO34962.1 hypothetical protein JJC00_04475 [Bradyrhizobium diazoefficiens]
MKLKRAKVQSQSLLSRLGGISAFGFGVSFKAPEPERQVVRDVITSLEDRRALYVGAISEQPDYVIKSVIEMRHELTSGLKRVGDGSPAKEAFRAMRAACRDFLTHPVMQESGQHMLHQRGLYQQEEFLLGLGKLRSVFGQQVALLGYLYGIDIEEQLASTLPPIPGNESDDK